MTPRQTPQDLPYAIDSSLGTITAGAIDADTRTLEGGLVLVPISARSIVVSPITDKGIARAFGRIETDWVSTQEIAVPDKPVPAVISSYEIVGFSQERYPDWRFTITYRDNLGKTYTDEHHGPSSIPNPAGGQAVNPDGAEAFLKQMNTANFSTVSFTKRLLQHLVTHGKIPSSTVTGEVEK
jgi:hypothetical protein